ncbi:MAG: nitroreductase family protein [Oscillospiraceae bacterium]|nr:nitroreductase family protein [Oscillospiraceae bacterium]
MGETFGALNARKSVRSYANKQVERKLLEKIADAGDKAPLGAPLAIRIITDTELLERIDKETHDRMKNSGVPFLVERASLPGYRPLYSAPVLIVIASDPARGPLGAGAAAENMIIAATDLGLGSCFVGSPMQTVSDPSYAEKIGLPEGFKPLAGVLVGYADDPTLFKRPRTPADIAYIE